MAEIKRIGILTGGGDCPGLNAVIRAVTKSARYNYGMEVVGISHGFRGLVTYSWKLLQESDVSGILPKGGTILGTSNRDNPFRYPVEAEDGTITFEDRSREAILGLERMKIDALVVVGGDGTQAIALGLHKLGVKVVGVPKTIDNDLMATDITFGFDSALQVATDAVDRLHTTAESHQRVMILEVMGRNTGWIAITAGLAGGGDVILIPEIPFTFEGVARTVNKRADRGKSFSIVVVAEGATLPDGMTVGRKGTTGETVLGGISAVIAAQVEALCRIETRVTILGHLQRGGTPSPFDRVLATRFGAKAVEMIAEGNFGSMASLKTPHIEAVPIEEAVSEQRRVSADGELVRFARAVGTSFGDD